MPASGQIGDSIGGSPAKLGTGVTVYKGALLTSNTAGWHVPAADTANFVFTGVAVEGSNGATTSNGGTVIRQVQRGRILLNFTGVAQTDVGRDAYVVDDNTVSRAAVTTNDVRVGIVDELGTASGTCWVSFNVEG